MKLLTTILFILFSTLCHSQQHKYFTVHGDTLFLRNADGSDSIQLNRFGISAATQAALDGKQAILVSGTNIKTINGNNILGSGDIPISGVAAWGNVTGTLANQTDLVNALNLKANLASPTFTGTVAGITAAMVGLGNVTNESKATMFANPTFTGTVAGITAAMVGLGNVTNESKATMFTSPTFTGTPIVPGYLPNTTTSGVAASPTASGTVTITHNLGRVPTTIRIKSISSFTSNAAATPVPFSEGTFNSSGNRCLYMVINGTTTQVSQTSTVFSIIMVTSAGNSISGVIGNVTSTSFDISFTEVGTHTAGNYLWEAQ